MSWAKFDDRYHDNRKVKRAWRRHPRAVGLHAMAVTYCSMHETDGLVDDEWIEEKVPDQGERGQVLAVLVDVGLFEPDEAGGFLVHDYLEYNRSKEAAVREREQKSARQQRWRERGRDASVGASVDASVDASTRRHGDAAPTRPDPTRPSPPIPPRGARKRDRERFEEEMAAWRDHHAPHPDTEAAEWSETVARLREAAPGATFDLHLVDLHPHGDAPDGRLVVAASSERLGWIAANQERLERVIGRRIIVVGCDGRAALEARQLNTDEVRLRRVV